MSYSKSEIEEFKPQEKNGSKILKKNKFFSDFTSLMRNIEFKEFYNNYFNDWSDIQTMIFYMKIYSTIENLYFNKYKNNISDELMTYMLHKIITTNETRKVAVELFKNFKGEKSDIIDVNKLVYFESLIDFDSTKNNLLIKN